MLYSLDPRQQISRTEDCVTGTLNVEVRVLEVSDNLHQLTLKCNVLVRGPSSGSTTITGNA